MHVQPNKKFKKEKEEKQEHEYQTNLFELELNELLVEITIPENTIQKYKEIIKDFVKSLKNLKPINDIKLSDGKLFEAKKLVMPLGELAKNMEGTYSFKPPAKVETIGGFLTNTSLKTKIITIDLSVEMPTCLFSERDYLNYRYFVKRNLYLANICIQLMETKKFTNKISFDFISSYSSIFKPVLLISFKESNLEVLIHCVPSNESFKFHRFNPNQNNVRREWYIKNFTQKFTLESNNKEDNENNDPNPNYNFEILSDIRKNENNEFLKDKLSSKSIKEAIRLLKLWMHKRELDKGYGSFDSFILEMFVAYLILNKKINQLMTHYQVFRITILELSEACWHKNGISIKDSVMTHSLLNNEEEDMSKVSNNEVNLKISDFHKHYQVVFLDKSGYLNITSNMSKNTLLKVKKEAKLSIKLLNNQFYDCFDSLFIHDRSMEECFDAMICLNPNENESFYRQITEKFPSYEIKLMDYLNNHYCMALKLIENYLEKSLDSRTDLIFIKMIPDLKWTIDKKSPTLLPKIVIGLNFNENYDRVLIKGPSSVTSEAIEFRNFWGPKSELRRFEDTSICEAVLFEAKDASSKRLVYSQIIKHIFKLHLSIEETNWKFCDQQLNQILCLPNGIIDNYGTGEERLADIVNTFEEFSKLVKNMKDLPIPIVNFQGISSSFRLTEVFSPLPCCFNYSENSKNIMQLKQDQKYLPKFPLGEVVAPYIKPLEVLCQLESSGKWPDDLECIKRLKTAFYLKLVQLIRQTYGLTAFTHVDYCDVIYKGFVFRIAAYTMNELFCMKNSLNEFGIIVTKETKKSISYEKKLLHLPKVSNFIHGLQQKNTCFSGVSRLAKRWLSSHFLMEYFEDETIDLICSYFFLEQSPFDHPKSLVSGFFRFLELISHFDWKNQMLIINFNNELKDEQLQSIKTNFQSNRSNLPAIFIVTSCDASQSTTNFACSLWTNEKPNLQQLCRTVMIAKNSYDYLKNCLINFESSDVFKNIFRPSVDNFDVAIKLKASYCVNAYQNIDIQEGTFLPRYRDYDPLEKDKTFPIVDFDAVRLYVNELRENFDELALFFYDQYGGTIVYVLWKPDAIKSKDCKFKDVKFRLIDSIKNNLELNVEAILEDFKLLGKGLIEKVELRNFK